MKQTRKELRMSRYPFHNRPDWPRSQGHTPSTMPYRRTWQNALYYTAQALGYLALFAVAEYAFYAIVVRLVMWWTR